ncbi:MAG: hypothetical protein J6Y48_18480 [Clostridia bacterium]|nr:hypothetical protein [Clostridia bacterium]
MKRLAASILAVLFIAVLTVTACAETVPDMRNWFNTPTATPAPDAFRFRDGIRWGMNPQQVKALETEQMTERSEQNWSIMLTDAKVSVSRFSADLVFMFRDNSLLMILYEFTGKPTTDDFNYLSGALSSLYGEAASAEPLKIKALMDAINPNRYKTEDIKEAEGWMTADGTTVYLYHYSPQAFAVMYVSPVIGSRIYQTNGL